MIKVIEKGYRLEVESWENDGDNYRTIFKTVNTLEEVRRLHTICNTLFKSRNKNGVGNSMDGRGDYIILEFFKENPSLFIGISEEDIIDYVSELGYDLMGGSEYYDFRVCDSCKVVYFPEDVYAEEIIL